MQEENEDKRSGEKVEKEDTRSESTQSERKSTLLDDASVKSHLHNMYEEMLQDVMTVSMMESKNVERDVSKSKSINTYLREAERSVYLRKNRWRKRELSVNIDDSLDEGEVEEYFKMTMFPHVFSDKLLPKPIGKDAALAAHVEKSDRNMPAVYMPTSEEAQAIRDAAFAKYVKMNVVKQDTYDRIMTQRATETTDGIKTDTLVPTEDPVQIDTDQAPKQAEQTEQTQQEKAEAPQTEMPQEKEVPEIEEAPQTEMPQEKEVPEIEEAPQTEMPAALEQTEHQTEQTQQASQEDAMKGERESAKTDWVYSMAGFTGCPFFEKARSKAKEMGHYKEEESFIMNSQSEYVQNIEKVRKHVMDMCQKKLWSSLEENGSTYNRVKEYTGRCKEQRAAIEAHTTCPLVWRVRGDEVEYVGGCDDFLALLKKGEEG